MADDEIVEKQPHQQHPDRWADGTQRPGFPGPALKHGLRAFQVRGALPDDLRLSVDEFRRGVISDQGGTEALTTLQAGYISRLCDVDVGLRMLQRDLVERGLFTARGRVRSTFGRLLETIGMWDKLAQRIGVDRKARAVNFQQRLATKLTGGETS